MKKYLSMAALVLVGAVMASCSSDDDFANDNKQQPANSGNVVTLTTTIGLDGGTRALTAEGVKTFVVGEQVALAYWNTSIDQWDKAVSQALTDKDISADGKTATLTFTLNNPQENTLVQYCYPAAMANDYGQADLAKLATQTGGTLASLAANYDLATGDGYLDGLKLPAVTLINQLAILAINLKNEEGSSDITSSITGLTVGDGTNTYNVSRSAVAGPIYVAIQPTTSATITVTATDGTKNYIKTLTGKTYAKGSGYNVSWRMAEAPVTDLSTISANYTAQNGETLTGTLASNVKISIADGATVTLKDVNINGSGTWTSGSYAGITCAGDATIILEGANTLKGFYDDYPGIYVPENKTVTIQGTGSLTASGGGWGCGIGGGWGIACGNITINGGTITATGGENAAGIGSGYISSCGNITISGGTITATGGDSSAGIGSGNQGSCDAITISGGTVTATGGTLAAGIGGGYNNGASGTINITSGVTQVTATKGEYAANSIGKGVDGSEITVTIEDPSKVTQN